MDIYFEGARPADADVSEVIVACTVYADQARERMGLHVSKRIVIRVPKDKARKALFRAAEPQLNAMRIFLDWQAYDFWEIPHSLAAEPIEAMPFERQPEWFYDDDVRLIRVFWGITDSDTARICAAKILAWADRYDEAQAPPPGLIPGPVPG